MKDMVPTKTISGIIRPKGVHQDAEKHPQVCVSKTKTSIRHHQSEFRR